FELRADVVLLTDKDELPRGSMIFVFEEVMHSQPKIFQAKLAKILSSNNKRIEVVLFEISPKLASPFFVFAPQEAESQKEQRYNDRRNDVDRELTLQSVDHIANILFITVGIGLRPISCPCSSETARRAVATDYPAPKLHYHHRFPTRLESVMFSTSVSVGRVR